VTFPGGINNHGQVVGLYIDNAGGGGFTLRDGTFTKTTAPRARSPARSPSTSMIAAGSSASISEWKLKTPPDPDDLA
jgi:hypothetical protein